MVYVVMMLLWLPIGSHANFENKGSSAQPDNTIWIVYYTLTNGFHFQALCTHDFALTCISEWLKSTKTVSIGVGQVMTRQVMMICISNDMTIYVYSKFIIAQYVCESPNRYM